MASAMTPEPTVAIVRSDRGDMAGSIRWRRREPTHAGCLGRRPPEHEEAIRDVTSAAANPAASSAGNSSSGS